MLVSVVVVFVCEQNNMKKSSFILKCSLKNTSLQSYRKDLFFLWHFIRQAYFFFFWNININISFVPFFSFHVIEHKIEGSHHFSFLVHLYHCKDFPDLVNTSSRSKRWMLEGVTKDRSAFWVSLYKAHMKMYANAYNKIFCCTSCD